MKADGSILIDTKIVDGGMEKGFELIKDEMSSVGITAKQVGEQIQLSFSKMDVSKPIANAVAKVQQLERVLAAVTAEEKMAVAEGDDKSAERLAAKRISAYDRLEAARERLSVELAHAVQKEAAAEEKAAQRAIRAAEKEAQAKKRIAEKQFDDMLRPARRFGSRFREILTGALIFNGLSAGLRSVTTYFGTALAANQEYARSLSALRGSLMTAFQPIYEFVLPAITTLINWLNIAVQVTGKLFSTLTGKSYSQMQKNAKALNNQANAISGVGDAAKEAARHLAGFDEINRLESVQDSSSGGIAGGGSSPLFEEIEIPSKWEAAIDALALKIKDIFFKWDEMNAEIIAEKLIAAFGVISGGLIGFSIGGPLGALIGMTIGAGLGVAISTITFDGDGKLSSEEVLSALTTALFSLCGGAIGFAVGGPLGAAVGMTVGAALGVKLSTIMFDGDGKISNQELIKALVSGISLIAGSIIGFAVGGPGGAVVGAVVGLGLGFSIQAVDFDGVESAIKRMLSSIREYFSNTFSNGFINGVGIMLNDAFNWISDMFWNFVNNLIANWNSIWGGILEYHTTGTISPQGYSAKPALAAYSHTPNVPYLAQGAVIPPNREFMAVLGDQKHGTNIEAPLETIKKAVAEVLKHQGVGGEVDVNITFDGSLSELIRILEPKITAQQRVNNRMRGV